MEKFKLKVALVPSWEGMVLPNLLTRSFASRQDDITLTGCEGSKPWKNWFCSTPRGVYFAQEWEL